MGLMSDNQLPRPPRLRGSSEARTPALPPPPQRMNPDVIRFMAGEPDREAALPPPPLVAGAEVDSVSRAGAGTYDLGASKHASVGPTLPAPPTPMPERSSVAGLPTPPSADSIETLRHMLQDAPAGGALFGKPYFRDRDDTRVDVSLLPKAAAVGTADVLQNVGAGMSLPDLPQPPASVPEGETRAQRLMREAGADFESYQRRPSLLRLGGRALKAAGGALESVLPKPWRGEVETAAGGPLFEATPAAANAWMANVGQQAPVLGAAAVGSAAGGPVGGWAAMSAMESGGFHKRAMQSGLDEDLATKYAGLYGPASGAIEYAQNAWMLGAGKPAAGAARPLVMKALAEIGGIGWEGLEELSQAGLENYLLGKAVEEHNARHPEAPLRKPGLMEGGLRSFALGAGTAGVARGTIAAARGAGRAMTETPTLPAPPSTRGVTGDAMPVALPPPPASSPTFSLVPGLPFPLTRSQLSAMAKDVGMTAKALADAIRRGDPIIGRAAESASRLGFAEAARGLASLGDPAARVEIPGEAAPAPAAPTAKESLPVAEKQPWQMTLKDWNGYHFDEQVHRGLPADYFDDYEFSATKRGTELLATLGNGIEIRRGKAGVVFAFDGETEVGMGDGKAFVVSPEYQRQGIGSALMEATYAGRPFGSRTAAGQSLIVAFHRKAVKAAVESGLPVPPSVLADYPDLAANIPGRPLPRAGDADEGPVQSAPQGAAPASGPVSQEGQAAETPVAGTKPPAFRPVSSLPGKGMEYVSPDVLDAAATAWSENRLTVDKRGNFWLSEKPVSDMGTGPRQGRNRKAIAPFNRELKARGVTWEQLAKYAESKRPAVAEASSPSLAPDYPYVTLFEAEKLKGYVVARDTENAGRQWWTGSEWTGTSPRFRTADVGKPGNAIVYGKKSDAADVIRIASETKGVYERPAAAQPPAPPQKPPAPPGAVPAPEPEPAPTPKVEQGVVVGGWEAEPGPVEGLTPKTGRTVTAEKPPRGKTPDQQLAEAKTEGAAKVKAARAAEKAAKRERVGKIISDSRRKVAELRAAAKRERTLSAQLRADAVAVAEKVLRGRYANEKRKVLRRIAAADTWPMFRAALARIDAVLEQAEHRQAVNSLRRAMKVARKKLRTLAEPQRSAVQDILKTFDFATPTKATMRRMAGLKKYLADNPDVEINAKQAALLERAARTPIGGMTTEELGEIEETLTRLVRLSELKDSIILKGRSVNWANSRRRAMGELSAAPKMKRPEADEPGRGALSRARVEIGNTFTNVYRAGGVGGELDAIFLDGSVDAEVDEANIREDFADNCLAPAVAAAGGEKALADGSRPFARKGTGIFRRQPKLTRKAFKVGGRTLNMTFGEQVGAWLYLTQPYTRDMLLLGEGVELALGTDPSGAAVTVSTPEDMQALREALEADPHVVPTAEALRAWFNRPDWKKRIADKFRFWTGTALKMEDNYWRVYRDVEFSQRLATIESFQDLTATMREGLPTGAGFLKTRSGGRKRLIVRDAFEQADTQMRTEAKFLAYTDLIFNGLQVMRDGEVRKAWLDHAGRASLDEMDKALRFLMQRPTGAESLLDTIMTGLTKTTTVAQLWGNLSSMLKQPLSLPVYATASNIDRPTFWKTALRLVTHPSEWIAARKRMLEHSSWARLRYKGAGLHNLLNQSLEAPAVGAETWRDKGMKGLGLFDSFTVAVAWASMEAQVSGTMLGGWEGMTDAQWADVEGRWVRATSETQPAWGWASLSGLSRLARQRPMMKPLLAYKTQPQQNINSVLRAMDAVHRAKGATGPDAAAQRTKAARGLLRALAIVALGTIGLTAVSTAFSVMRGGPKRAKDLSAGGFAADVGQNLVTQVPLADIVATPLLNGLRGQAWRGGYQTPVASQASYLFRGLGQAGKLVDASIEGEASAEKLFTASASLYQGLAGIVGLPVAPLYEIRGAARWARGEEKKGAAAKESSDVEKAAGGSKAAVARLKASGMTLGRARIALRRAWAGRPTREMLDGLRTLSRIWNEKAAA